MKKKMLKVDLDAKGSKREVCPVCGNNNLKYGDSGVEKIFGEGYEMYFYKWKCKCGVEGSELFKILYTTYRLIPAKN